MVFFPKAHSPSLNMRKAPDKPRSGVILQDTWPALLKTIKVMKEKQRVRNCHRPEMGNATTKYNVCPGLKKKEGINGKTGQIQIKSGVWQQR